MNSRKFFPSLLPILSETVNRHYYPRWSKDVCVLIVPYFLDPHPPAVRASNPETIPSPYCAQNRFKNTLTTKIIFYFSVCAYFFTCFRRFSFFIIYTYIYMKYIIQKFGYENNMLLSSPTMRINRKTITKIGIHLLENNIFLMKLDFLCLLSIYISYTHGAVENCVGGLLLSRSVQWTIYSRGKKSFFFNVLYI